MEHVSNGSLSRARLYSPAASATLSPDAEAQQQEIIAEEERSSEAAERAVTALPALEESVPNDELALAAQGRALSERLDVLRVVGEELRAAARSACRAARETRNRAVSARELMR